MPWILTEIRSTGIDVEPYSEAGLALRDMTAPLTLMGEDILAAAAESFASEGASGDRPWPPLSPGYQRWKSAHGPGLPKLIGLKAGGSKGSRPQTYGVSGEMKRELLSPASLHVTPHSLMYLPLSDIAGFHQTGTPKMPARPPVPLSERQLLGWDKILEGWVDAVFVEAGL